MMRNKGQSPKSEPVDTGPRVSELLKTTRERQAMELQTVADVLRIRFVYLQAIEDGRYEDLPGKTYVVGFVRAYSEYLGLDVEEVVNRFKLEVDGLEAKADLVFPSPVTEQSVPGGAIILISLIILGVAYGGWYMLSSQDRSMAELVPDLPAKFAEMVDKVKDGQNATSENEPAAQDAPAEPVAEETAREETPAADPQNMAQAALEAVERAEEAEAVSEEETPAPIETVKIEEAAAAVEEEPTPEPAPVAEAEETTEPESPAPVEAAEETASTPETEPAEEASETEVAAVEPESEAPAAGVEEEEVVEEPAAPAVMTETIILKAIDYAWVQVTDTDGNVIHTKAMEEGEEYQIPKRAGLILRTGNAGGLEITVDGEKVPSIGDVGEVRRKVLIDPAKLISGDAVES